MPVQQYTLIIPSCSCPGCGFTSHPSPSKSDLLTACAASTRKLPNACWPPPPAALQRRASTLQRMHHRCTRSPGVLSASAARHSFVQGAASIHHKDCELSEQKSGVELLYAIRYTHAAAGSFAQACASYCTVDEPCNSFDCTCAP